MVYVHLADGFEEVEALTIVDLLRRAGIETVTVSIMERLPVKGSHDIKVVADILFEDAVYGECEMIVLPGGMPGAKNLEAHEGLLEKIYSFYNQDKWIAAICAAPMILGHAGILKEKKATCYPGFEKDLEDAEFVTDEVASDGKIITSRSLATAIPFALKIIESLKGEETAEKISAGILYE